MKKIFALLLVVALCFSLFSVNVFAQEASANDEKIYFTYEATNYQNEDTDYIKLEICLNVDTDIARFWGIDVFVKFDDNLMLKGVDGCLLNEIIYTNFDIANSKNAVKISQDMYPSSDITLENGQYTFATLEFEVAKNPKVCQFDFAIDLEECSLARGMSEIFDNELIIDYGTGATIALPHLISKGDVNSDMQIDNKDLGLLMQYINGWKVEIDTQAADLTSDGQINNKDYARLMQYINDWDVQL